LVSRKRGTRGRRRRKMIRSNLGEKKTKSKKKIKTRRGRTEARAIKKHRGFSAR